MITASQINRYNKHSEKNPLLECISPICDELNYETSQVQCPHRGEDPLAEKCQKLFKNIMALNVHLQMYHKETGITTVIQNDFHFHSFFNMRICHSYLGIK